MGWSDPDVIKEMEHLALAEKKTKTQPPAPSETTSMIGFAEQLIGTVATMAKSADHRDQAFGEITLAVLNVRTRLNKASLDGNVVVVNDLIKGTLDALAMSYASIMANQPPHIVDMVKRRFETAFERGLTELVEEHNGYHR